MSAPLLEVRHLEIGFGPPQGGLEAVRGVDFRLEAGEVLGIVGESGSGKSLSMLAVMGLLDPKARVRGSVRLKGEELLGLSERQLRALRGRRMGMIFQDPMTTLNPVLTVGAQLVECLRIHDRGLSRRAAMDRAVELLELVAIPFPRRRVHDYPHQFSGGMRQRAMIAMAVAHEPDLLIADEPTTALDVTIQAQILELLGRLRAEKGIGLVLITHDLGIVAGMADRVAIMYAGRVAETGPVRELFYQPRHPYTRGLLGSLPKPDRMGERLLAIDGAPPSLAARPPGCAFHPRCPYALPACAEREPLLEPLGEARVACLRAREFEA